MNVDKDMYNYLIYHTHSWPSLQAWMKHNKLVVPSTPLGQKILILRYLVEVWGWSNEPASDGKDEETIADLTKQLGDMLNNDTMADRLIKHSHNWRGR